MRTPPSNRPCFLGWCVKCQRVVGRLDLKRPGYYNWFVMGDNPIDCMHSKVIGIRMPKFMGDREED